MSSLDFYDTVDNDRTFTPQNMDNVEAEMRRLKQELKQTMDMYSTGVEDAVESLGRENLTIQGRGDEGGVEALLLKHSIFRCLY
ncbi:hypothetical protein ACS0TY_029083 [Phlomoides rotata]